jgi:hypothetical protein
VLESSLRRRKHETDIKASAGCNIQSYNLIEVSKVGITTPNPFSHQRINFVSHTQYRIHEPLAIPPIFNYLKPCAMLSFRGPASRHWPSSWNRAALCSRSFHGTLRLVLTEAITVHVMSAIGTSHLLLWSREWLTPQYRPPAKMTTLSGRLSERYQGATGLG